MVRKIRYFVFQISYSFLSQAQSDKFLFPFFYRVVPKEGAQYPMIIKLLQHFRWMIVYLIAPDSDGGERFMRSLTPLLVSNGICVVLSQSIPVAVNEVRLDPFKLCKWTQVNVFVYFAAIDTFMMGIMIMQKIIELCTKATIGKVWLTSAMWDITFDLQYNSQIIPFIYGYISFLNPNGRNSKYNDVRSIYFSAIDFMDKAFCYSYSKHGLSVKGWTRCPENKDLEALS